MTLSGIHWSVLSANQTRASYRPLELQSGNDWHAEAPPFWLDNGTLARPSNVFQAPRGLSVVTITISDELKSRVPGLALGCVTAEVPSVAEHDEGLWREIDSHLARLTAAYKADDIPALSQVAAMRAAYKALGKEPSRYRGSAEALLRRVLSGKALYQINNVVDVNNLVSWESLKPLGAYDLDQVRPPIQLIKCSKYGFLVCTVMLRTAMRMIASQISL